MTRALWPHQELALDALRQSIGQGVRRIVLSSPTGSGKTVLAAAVIEGALRKNNRVAFVISNLSLVDQSLEALYREGIRDVGIIQSAHIRTDWSRPVQIASIQTIRARAAYPEAQVVIIDEVHVLYEAHKQWMQHPDWKSVPFIGLSATPYTKGLGKYFETMIVVATTQELIDKGVLCPFRVYASGHPDLTGVRVVAGDYVETELSEAMQRGTLTADIVRTWQEKWGKDKTLCFGVDCAHAQALQKRFVEAGITCGYQDARTPWSERSEIKKKFHNGEYRVVTNVGTLTTGTDWDCRCLILARPTKSEMLYQQIIGRSLRIADGKPYSLILDHSDTTQRLGFVTDISHDRLDDGKPKAKANAPIEPPLPRECPGCGVLFPKRKAVCPNCGYKVVIESGYIERDGELIELTPGAGTPKRGKGKREYSLDERAQFLASLKAYGTAHNRKPGFAAANYKEKFGIWPEWSIKDVPPAEYASAEVSMWCKSRAIAWHKGQAKRKAQEAGADVSR